LDIFDILKIGYFPYFSTLLLDVKTSLKCENRHLSFQYCLLFNFKTFLPCDARSAKCGVAIHIIISSPILKYTT